MAESALEKHERLVEAFHAVQQNPTRRSPGGIKTLKSHRSHIDNRDSRIWINCDTGQSATMIWRYAIVKDGKAIKKCSDCYDPRVNFIGQSTCKNEGCTFVEDRGWRLAAEADVDFDLAAQIYDFVLSHKVGPFTKWSNRFCNTAWNSKLSNDDIVARLCPGFSKDTVVEYVVATTAAAGSVKSLKSIYESNCNRPHEAYRPIVVPLKPPNPDKVLPSYSHGGTEIHHCCVGGKDKKHLRNNNYSHDDCWRKVLGIQ